MSKTITLSRFAQQKNLFTKLPIFATSSVLDDLSIKTKEMPFRAPAAPVPQTKRCVGNGYIKRQSLSGSITEEQRNMETWALFLAVLCYGHFATEGSPLRIEWTGLDDPWGLLKILRTGYNAGDIGER
mgnify:CR=1 FL=1